MATVDVDPVNGVLAVSCSRRWLGQLSKETMTRVQESAGPLDLGLVTSSEYEVAGHAQWLTMGVARAGVEGAGTAVRPAVSRCSKVEIIFCPFERADLIQVGESERRCPEVSRLLDTSDRRQPALDGSASITFWQRDSSHSRPVNGVVCL